MRLILSIFSLTLLTNISCQTSSNQTDSDNGGIIFKDSLGHVLSKSDLSNITTGQVNYEIMGNQNIDPNASKLHQEARELGQSGKYDLSISKLEQAIKIEPTWAYPFYDLGYTYLLKGDFDNALKFYKKTNELEPKGFFTAKTALYSLEGEKLGKFPKGLYSMYMQIEWTDDVAKKLDIAKTISEKVPNYAPAWKELSMLLDDQTERLNAIEKGLLMQPDSEIKGVLTINKALILDNSGKKEEAKKLLGNLIFSPDVTTGNLELAKFTLKSLTENPSSDK